MRPPRALAVALTLCVAGCAAPASPRDGAAGDSADVDSEAQNDSGARADASALTDTSIAPLDVPRPAAWIKPVRVLVLAFDPIVEARNNARLHAVYRWNDPRALAPRAVDALVRGTGGAARVEVVGFRELDSYGQLVDGFVYDDDSFARCWEDRTHAQCHTPQGLDYPWLVRTYGLCEGVTRGDYDEVWLFGAPYFGYWESTMVGPQSFFLNSQPVRFDCGRTFVIMGFNYERGLAEMLHDYGHRTEFTMAQVTRGGATPNAWTRFSAYDRRASGQSGCGNTHNPPNASGDYDYVNAREVLSNCDAFLSFPAVTAAPRATGCSAWGCNEEGYQRWWIDHVPRAVGVSSGLQNNWWKYVFGFEEFIP